MAAIPTPTTDRYHLLDALRGFALWGIVIANYPVMSYWFLTPEAEQALLPFSAFDPLLQDLEAIFIQGKFYSIFSLLFGIGFGIFLAKGGTQRFLRRMVVLAMIGWIHLRFFWEGDILLLYALIGLMLHLFKAMRDRWLLGIAAVLLLIPIPLQYLMEANVYTWPGELWQSYRTAGEATGMDDTQYFNGGLHEFLTHRSVSWRARVAHVVSDHRPPKVLALFLIGLFVARRALFREPGQHKRMLRKVLLWGGAIGLCATLIAELGPLPSNTSYVALLALGTAPLALAIAAAFTLAWTRERGRRLLHVFSPAGRMALTNYLGQTLLGQLVFSGVGLALGPRIGLAAIFAIAITVFIVQVILSHWWLARFQYGPFEWLWRMLTYGRVVPMRKRKPSIVTQQRTETLEPL